MIERRLRNKTFFCFVCVCFVGVGVCLCVCGCVCVCKRGVCLVGFPPRHRSRPFDSHSFLLFWGVGMVVGYRSRLGCQILVREDFAGMTVRSYLWRKKSKEMNKRQTKRISTDMPNLPKTRTHKKRKHKSLSSTPISNIMSCHVSSFLSSFFLSFFAFFSPEVGTYRHAGKVFSNQYLTTES